jgi:hypothetical protein
MKKKSFVIFVFEKKSKKTHTHLRALYILHERCCLFIKSLNVVIFIYDKIEFFISILNLDF